ncbi:11633_t:CDS:2 [Racocetra fulgida]|uniref:11633_t:CDS:1 n=1 Tax=Racocetra fulgida TaxID=60492 RepID=A0A9N9J6C3_9GLOM|nr:11633_t:CDS:2 [Racocetra fulgida]
MEFPYYNTTSESSLVSEFPYDSIFSKSYDFQSSTYDNYIIKNEALEYYGFQYGGYDNSMINEVYPEYIDADNETQVEDTNEVHNDDCGQQSDELYNSDDEKQMKPLVLTQELQFET